MSFIELNPAEQKSLLSHARNSIRLHFHHSLEPTPPSSPALDQRASSFVTLTLMNELRGCIGSLSAYQPLVDDVTEHAIASAFSDHRFRPLKPYELTQLSISISVLMPRSPLHVHSQSELCDTLRPGVDGLVLKMGTHQATFLPSVWEHVSDPDTFINALKKKAGLSARYWSEDMHFARYETRYFSENDED